MRRPSFLVLTALAGAGPLHGYGLVQTIQSMTDGAESLSLGGVYGVLDRLEGLGQVRLHSETIEAGRARRYYAITDAGRQALSAEADRMDADARLGRRMLQVPASGAS
jgi:DNA-binding PadR family transcriptional regulator